MFHSWIPKCNFVKISKPILPCSQYFLFHIHDARMAALMVQYTEFITTVGLLPHTANDEGNGARLGTQIQPDSVGLQKMPTARLALVTTQTPVLWVLDILARGQSGRDVKLNTHPATAEVRNARINAFTYANTFVACAGANLRPAFSDRFGSCFVRLVT
jgi:hypothetical protein